MSADRIRIQLDVAPEAAANLDRLVESTGAASRAEVVRRALSLYDRFLAIEASDGEVRVIQDGQPERILLLI